MYGTAQSTDALAEKEEYHPFVMMLRREQRQEPLRLLAKPQILALRSLMKSLMKSLMNKTVLLLIAVVAAPTFLAPVQAQPNLDDGQIADIITVAHSIDIAAGKLAQFKSSNAEVLFFAQRMVTDHGVALESQNELIKRHKITPAENPVTQRLRSAAEKNVARLTPLRGLAFEREYIDHEVVFHTHMLETIDDVLIPNARNEQLKNSLVKVRPAFFSHLQHAVRMQGFLKKE
jgi:putative membrane protein